MHFNKHGWGLRDMLILSGILVLFLIVAIYYIYSLYNGIGEEATFKSYYKLEEKLENQALIYLSDYYDDDLTSDPVTITRSVLRSYDLDVSLVDIYGNACSGYIIANKSKGLVHVDGYIKCKDYMTDGYEEWRS